MQSYRRPHPRDPLSLKQLRSKSVSHSHPLVGPQGYLSGLRPSLTGAGRISAYRYEGLVGITAKPIESTSVGSWKLGMKTAQFGMLTSISIQSTTLLSHFKPRRQAPSLPTTKPRLRLSLLLSPSLSLFVPSFLS